ncbi:hypothetical protein DYQ86_02445 [Acidobacteria bacterium AB60]|nr:hypothetical protein DYQ86_02445 [Acidobacteria bacterium AB60]
MKTERLETIDREKMVYIDEYFQKRYVHPMVALRELYELLEAYGPLWYTRETRALVQDALREYFRI